jgi:hypothetical protein
VSRSAGNPSWAPSTRTFGSAGGSSSCPA